MSYQLKFNPPAMPFAYTLEQAYEIANYVEFYQCMKRVYEAFFLVEKEYFTTATSEEKDAILYELTNKTLDRIKKDYIHWSVARYIAIKQYEDYYGYDSYGRKIPIEE